MPFLTVMQVGPANLSELTTSAFATADTLMIGSRIITAAGEEYLVLFNNRAGTVPLAIASTNYPLIGATSATHLLCGMKPAGKYQIVISNGVVTVAENPAGAFTASAGGVLMFQPSAVSGAAKAAPGETGELRESGLSLRVFPNPSNGAATVGFRLPESGKVKVRVLNLLGGTVADLLDRQLPAGVHAVEWNGKGEPAGTYLVEIIAGARRDVQRLVLTN
ncbi:MAG: T9SS C-terminal target domain-containing protein [Chlorobi bacterium CHB2]|nr:T9SS C-terminal target domain-containing protein [Chlorobi bacterium CHB2]